MKPFKLLFIHFIILGIISCQSHSSGVSESAVKSNMDLAVEGMVCAIGCAKGIEEKMLEIDGIISCEVSFDKKQAHIEFDRSVLKSAEIKEIIEKMNDGQYKVQILQEETEATEKKEVKQENASTRGSSSDHLSVKDRSFSFPHLLTSFMKNL